MYKMDAKVVARKIQGMAINTELSRPFQYATTDTKANRIYLRNTPNVLEMDYKHTFH